MSSKYIYDGATRYPEATELEKAVPKYGPMLRFECLFNAFNITKPIFSYGYVRGLGDKKLGKREGQLMIHVPWRDLMQGGFKVSLENWLPPTHEGANFIAEAWNSSVSFVRMPTDWELPELPGHGPVKRPYLAIHITKLDWRKKAGLLYNTLPSNLLAIFHPEEAGRLKSLIDASQKSDTTSVRKTFAEVPLEPKDWPEFNLELTPSAAADVTEPVVPTVPPLICSFVTAISDLKKSVQQREDESQREKWASNYDADADDNADRKHQRGREILEEALYRHDERENLPTGVQPEKCNRKLVLAIRKISIDGETAWPEEFGGFDRMPVTLLVCAPEGSIKHKVARDEIATLEFDFPLPNIAEVVKILGVPKDMEGIEFKLDDRGHALMNCSQFTAMQKAMTMTTNLYIHVPLENPTTKAVIRNLSLLIDQAPKLISTHLPQMEFVVRQDSLQLNLTSPSLPSLSGDTALAKSNVRQQHKAYRRLDHEQRAVVDNVFNAKPSPETNRPHYVAVQGPPGTGKTTMATVLAMLSYHAICQARVSRNNPDWLAGPQIILTAPTKAVTRLLFGRTVLASRTETAQDDARFHFLLSTPKSLDKVNDDDEFKKYTLMGQITALAWHIKRKVENDFMAKCFKEELVVAAKRWTSPRETGDKKSRNQAQHTLTVELYKRCIVLATTMDHFQAACENFDVNAAIVIADEVAVAQVPSCIPFIFHAAPITVVIGDNKHGRPYKSTHQNLVGKLLSKLGSYQLSTQYRCREAQYLVNQAGIYSRKVDSYVSIKEVSVPYDHLSKEYDNVFDAYYIKPTSSVASADAPDAPSSPSQPHKSLTSVAFADVQGSSSESHKFLASNSKQIASNSKAVHCPQNDSEVIIDSMIFKALRTANNASWLPEFHDIKGRHSRQGTSSLNIEQTTAMINLYKKAIELGADPPSKDYIASRFLWLSYYRGQAYYAQDELQKAGLPLPRFSTVAKAQGDEAPFVFLSLTKITDWISSVEHQMDAEKDDNNNKAVKKAKKPSEPINLSELSYPNLMKWTEYRPGEFTLSAGSLDVAISRQKVGLFVFGNLDLFKRAFAREVKLLENDAELAASIQDGKRLANVVTNTTSVIHIRPDMEDEDEDKGARSKDQRPMRVKSDRPRSNRRSQAMSFMFRKPEEYGTVEGKISPKANIRTSDDWGNGNDNPDHAVDSTANSVSDHTTANVATSGTPSDATAPTGTVIDPTANVATSGTPLDATAPSAAADVNGKKKMSRRNHRGSLKLKNNGAE